MPQRIERLTRSFIAKDEAGTEYTLHIFTMFERIAIPSGFYEKEVGIRLVTDDGLAVFRLEKGRYEMIGFPPVLLTSDDPPAP